ncbi:hypothetical protein B9Z19DRAFT_1123859 [Tuber borchii]|uniref:Uncharacterized protein n=1 Tax=Tuber borchii TaxID=42251 RepID=A0A2T6ZXM1_TUBBO|nr:hypothetical protein B9Z19DRAFT_1123859 [Tuber borchii]
MSARRRLEQRRLGAVNQALEKTTPQKPPLRAWRQITIGNNITRPQKREQWKPLMLSLDQVITPEQDTLIHSSQSGKQNWFWMSVEIKEIVSSSAGHAGQSQGVGLESVYLGYILLSIKSAVKSIVVSIESAMDRVVVMIFPCAMLNNMYTLSVSGSAARQHVNDAVIAAIQKLKAAMEALAAIHINARDPTGDWPVEQQINSTQASPGHSSYLPSTTLLISRTAGVHKAEGKVDLHDVPGIGV